MLELIIDCIEGFILTRIADFCAEKTDPLINKLVKRLKRRKERKN